MTIHNASHRAIGIVLLSAMLCSMAASCGTGEQTQETTAQDAVTTTAPETQATHDADGFLLDSIPDSLDFGGETITILGWNHYEDIEFKADEQTGEIVNDAYFTRNQRVEERLNVKLEFLEAEGRYGQTTFIDNVTKSVMSGSGDYDLTAGYSLGVASAVVSGIFTNLLSVEHLDFSKPWWSQQLVDSVTIADALFFTAGDISSSSISRIQGIFFNADMLTDFSLENPYQLTVDGKWTLDKMLEMTAGVYKDMNGNNAKDEADRFGFTCDRTQFQPSFFTSGMRAVVTDDTGKPVLSDLLAGERAVDVLEKIATFMSASKDGMVIAKTDDNTTFLENRALFHAFPLALISSEKLRSVRFDYGFVPWPKYTEEEEHVVVHSNAFTLWSIPLDAADISRSGAVMETMASEGHRTIAPALFEMAYKVKYNTDESDLQSQIFDEMRANILVDAGRVFASLLPFNFSIYANCITKNEMTWVSTVESNRKALQKALDDIYAACKEYADK